jgi:hypothetical protein
MTKIENRFTERRRFLKSSFMVGLATGITISHSVNKLREYFEEKKEEKMEEKIERKKCPPVLANNEREKRDIKQR